MRMIQTFACLLCEKLLEPLVFSNWLVKVAFFVGQNSNARIAFILGWREYPTGKEQTLSRKKNREGTEKKTEQEAGAAAV
jgi:hypothetical protein